MQMHCFNPLKLRPKKACKFHTLSGIPLNFCNNLKETEIYSVKVTLIKNAYLRARSLAVWSLQTKEKTLTGKKSDTDNHLFGLTSHRCDNRKFSCCICHNYTGWVFFTLFTNTFYSQYQFPTYSWFHMSFKFQMSLGSYARWLLPGFLTSIKPWAYMFMTLKSPNP